MVAPIGTRRSPVSEKRALLGLLFDNYAAALFVRDLALLSAAATEELFDAYAVLYYYY